eukprot:TRINITY_DN12880_c0_g1_i1.p1 TRINITY_DN12880_c0_g1~~TRINITY_DN12880_c0_g1_i1.p1  ORF type:complete len:701 (-),score=170.95 TRINITY_DN12880_c0_g1_i1:160-2262(-)
MNRPPRPQGAPPPEEDMVELDMGDFIDDRQMREMVHALQQDGSGKKADVKQAWKSEGLSDPESRSSSKRGSSKDASGRSKRRGVVLRGHDKQKFSLQNTMKNLESVSFLDDSLSSKVQDIVLGLLVTGNVVAIGLEVDYGNMGGDRGIFLFLDYLFNIVFLADIGIRLTRDGPMKYFLGFEDRFRWRNVNWLNLIDLGLVFIRFLDLILAVVGFPTVLKVVSVLRLNRLRLTMTRMKVIRGARELFLVLTSLTDTMKTIVWALFVGSIILLLAAVVAATAIGLNDEMRNSLDYTRSVWTADDYWGSVSKAYMTLFQIWTGDSWSEGAFRPLIRRSPAAIIPLVLLLCFLNLCIFNVITAVVVEGTLASGRASVDKSTAQELEDLYNKVAGSMKQIFIDADLDGNKQLDRQEFRLMMYDKRILDRLHLLDIPSRDMQLLFELLDTERTGCVDLDRFFRSFQKLRGDAKRLDTHKLHIDLQRSLDEVDVLTDFVTATNDAIGEVLDLMDNLDREVIRGGEEDKDPVMMARRNRKRAPGTTLSSLVRGKVVHTVVPRRLGVKREVRRSILPEEEEQAEDELEDLEATPMSRSPTKHSSRSGLTKQSSSGRLLRHQVRLTKWQIRPEQSAAEEKAWENSVEIDERRRLPAHMRRTYADEDGASSVRTSRRPSKELVVAHLTEAGAQAHKQKMRQRANNFHWGVN